VTKTQPKPVASLAKVSRRSLFFGKNYENRSQQLAFAIKVKHKIVAKVETLHTDWFFYS